MGWIEAYYYWLEDVGLWCGNTKPVDIADLPFCERSLSVSAVLSHWQHSRYHMDMSSSSSFIVHITSAGCCQRFNRIASLMSSSRAL